MTACRACSIERTVVVHVERAQNRAPPERLKTRTSQLATRYSHSTLDTRHSTLDTRPTRTRVVAASSDARRPLHSENVNISRSRPTDHIVRTTGCAASTVGSTTLFQKGRMWKPSTVFPFSTSQVIVVCGPAVTPQPEGPGQTITWERYDVAYAVRQHT